MKDDELIMKIKRIINLSGMSASAFANKIGFNQSNLSKMLRGERKVSRNLIVAILEKGYATFEDFALPNANEIIVGEGSMLTAGDNNQFVVADGNVTNSNNRTTGTSGISTAKAVKPYLREELVNIPYVPVDAKASFIESLYDNAYEVETYGVMAEDGELLNETEYKVFQIDGDSMAPNIPDRSKVLAKIIPEVKWEEAAGVVFVVYGKTLTIKRILKNSLFGKNLITLKADNPIYGQVDVERGEIRGMWQAIRIVSQRIV